jgi:predicted nucleic acid-binding protein
MHSAAKSFLSRQQPRKVVSALTFEELSAVLARIRPGLQLPEPLQKEPFKRRVRAAVEYIFKDSGLNLASQVGTSIIHVGERTVSIPMEYSKAASEAHRLKLKALDLLHLAYASLINRLEFKLDFFVTGDGDILDAAREIQDSLGLRAVDPKNAV